MDNIGRLDWTHIQAFLAVAESGSLSAAARELGFSQPTLGRQVRAAEDAMGVELFHRQPRGLVLTETGETLLEHAREMQAAAVKLSMAAISGERGLKGVVKITASEIVAHFQLPDIIAIIRRAEPDIELEIYPSNTSKNLLFREADIAIRMYRTEQLDIIAKHIGDIRLGMFASLDYISRYGVPENMDQLAEHEFVGYAEDEQIIKGIRQIGIHVDKHFFKTRCDQQVVHWELARAGCGIGFGQLKLGQTDAGMVQVLPDIDIPPLPIWLTAPEALRTNPRIRRVYDLLASELVSMVDA